MRVVLVIRPGPGACLVPFLAHALHERGWVVQPWLEPGAEADVGPEAIRRFWGEVSCASGELPPGDVVILLPGARPLSPPARVVGDIPTDVPVVIRRETGSSGPLMHQLDDGGALARPIPDPEALTALAEAICEAASALVTPPLLAGRRILVTAGPTREDLDPVRFLTNRSTGRMGVALAKAAWRHGAAVHLIHGPMQCRIPRLASLTAQPVRSARDMYEAVLGAAPDVDVVIMCAAVADFCPETAAAEKLKKEGASLAELRWKRTPDILAALGRLPAPRPLLVGFAAETHDHAAQARKKLRGKHCDLICANDVSSADSGFEVDTNRITLHFRDGRTLALPLLSKTEAAMHILQRVADLLA